MIFGSSTFFFQEHAIEEALGHIRTCGFAAAEVWMEHLWKTRESPEQLGRRAAALDLRLSLHAASYDVNIASANAGIRRESLRQIVESMEAAARMGCRTVVVHPGSLSSSKGDAEEHWRLMEEAVAEIDRRAGELGLTVGVEAMEKRAKQIYVTPEDVARLMRAGLGNIGATVDLAHVTGITDHESFLSGLDARWIVHAHLSDSSPRATHAPLGRGTTDIDAALSALAKRYDGTVILEGFVPGRGRETVCANYAYLRNHGWTPG